MPHIEEQLLEAYARQPEKLPGDARQSVEAHLAACAACQSIAEFLRTFYADLLASPPEVAPQVQALVEALFPLPHIIPLYPFQPKLQAISFGDGYTTVLAAMSPVTPRRFQTVATFAAEPQNTLVRITYDNVTDVFKLYVLADDPRKRGWAIVSFPQLAADFVTDERGQVAFQLSAQARPENWAALEAVLRLPIAAAHLAVDRLQQNSAPQLLETTAADYAVALSYADKTLTIAVRSIKSPAQIIQRVVVKTTTGQTFLITLRDGKGDLNLDALPETLTLRLYC
ncbi:MAG: zf-HC2 domain-containing protein [bacterium]